MRESNLLLIEPVHRLLTIKSPTVFAADLGMAKRDGHGNIPCLFQKSGCASV